MSIRLEQPGASKAAAAAGTMIGKAERAKEDRARAEREQAQAAQDQARQTAMQWELQKMTLNSQQDFAHEMRMKQAGLEAEARAQEWQVEKMELASRMDFEQDEKERLRRKAEYTAGRDSIDKNEGLTDAQKEQANFLLSTKYSDLSEAAAGLGLKPEKQDPLDKRIAEALKIDDTVEPPPTVSDTTTIKPPPPGEIKVISPDGQTGNIPEVEWEAEKDTTYKGFKKLTNFGVSEDVGLNRKVGSLNDISRFIKRKGYSYINKLLGGE